MLLKFNRVGFEVGISYTVIFNHLVDAGDGDVLALFWKIIGVGVISFPYKFQSLLAAGGCIWDNYSLIHFAGLRICVGFEPARNFYDFFYIVFRHNQHVKDC